MLDKRYGWLTHKLFSNNKCRNEQNYTVGIIELNLHESIIHLLNIG